MGRALAADDIPKMTDFVQNKYDSFTKIYETCRLHSEDINDIKTIDKECNNKSELNIKVSTDAETLEKISENLKDNEKVSLDGDVLTAKD
jgi:hypothetical protein